MTTTAQQAYDGFKIEGLKFFKEKSPQDLEALISTISEEID